MNMQSSRNTTIHMQSLQQFLALWRDSISLLMELLKESTESCVRRKLRQGLILILMQMEVRFRQIHTYIIQLISRFFMTDTEERLPELITVMVLTAMHLVRNYTRVQAEQRFRLIHMSILCLTWTRPDTVWMTIRLLVQNCFQELEQTDILRLQVIMERQSILETILTRQIMNHYISLAI